MAATRSHSTPSPPTAAPSASSTRKSLARPARGWQRRTLCGGSGVDALRHAARMPQRERWGGAVAVPARGRRESQVVSVISRAPRAEAEVLPASPDDLGTPGAARRWHAPLPAPPVASGVVLVVARRPRPVLALRVDVQVPRGARRRRAGDALCLLRLPRPRRAGPRRRRGGEGAHRADEPCRGRGARQHQPRLLRRSPLRARRVGPPLRRARRPGHRRRDHPRPLRLRRPGLHGMTVHPKKDPVTGEVFAFRYGPVPPFVTYFWFDRDGNKQGPDVPIFSVRQPSFLHDFAVTERYAIFPEIQIVMQPMGMVAGGAPVGSDAGKVPRLGVLPRYAADESEMRWFEVPGLNPMHAVNAWEEAGGEELVLVAPNVLSVEHALERMELVHSSVEKVRINLRTGAVSRTPLSAANLDFGVIHPGYLGRRNRYGYLGIGDPMPKISGVVKLDMDLAGTGDCTVARRDFGPGCFAGEPSFVPDDVEGGGAEDDGYVVCYVHDEGTGENRFVVMDARSPQLEIVAEVELPARVPYGFHGIFLTQAELQAQRQR